MTGEFDFDGWAQRIIRAYHVPPINAHRVLALGLDGSNAVAIKVASDGTVATSGGAAGATVSIAVMPAITGNVTVMGEVSTEAIYATHVSQGINLTHTTTWTVAISTPTTMWRLVKVRSTADVDMQISYDGGTTKHDTIPAGDGFVLDLKGNDMHETSWISIRNDGSAPSRGKVYVFAAGT